MEMGPAEVDVWSLKQWDRAVMHSLSLITTMCKPGLSDVSVWSCCPLRLSLERKSMMSQGFNTKHQSWSTKCKTIDTSSNCVMQITLIQPLLYSLSVHIVEVLSCLLPSPVHSTHTPPAILTVTHLWVTSFFMNKTWAHPRVEAFVLVNHCSDWT